MVTVYVAWKILKVKFTMKWALNVYSSVGKSKRSMRKNNLHFRFRPPSVVALWFLVSMAKLRNRKPKIGSYGLVLQRKITST